MLRRLGKTTPLYAYAKKHGVQWNCPALDRAWGKPLPLDDNGKVIEPSAPPAKNNQKPASLPAKS